MQPQYITEPNTNDVLCGRGKPFIMHSGNTQFRSLVEARKVQYISSKSNREKIDVANIIMRQIENMDPPGRFLKKHSISIDMAIIWCVIPKIEAIKKIRQALREGNTVRNKPKLLERKCKHVELRKGKKSPKKKSSKLTTMMQILADTDKTTDSSTNEYSGDLSSSLTTSVATSSSLTSSMTTVCSNSSTTDGETTSSEISIIPAPQFSISNYRRDMRYFSMLADKYFSKGNEEPMTQQQASGVNFNPFNLRGDAEESHSISHDTSNVETILRQESVDDDEVINTEIMSLDEIESWIDSS